MPPTNNKETQTPTEHEKQEKSAAHIQNRATIKPRMSLSNQRKVEEVRLAAMFGSLAYDLTDLHFTDVRDERKGKPPSTPTSTSDKDADDTSSASSQEKVLRSLFEAIDKEIPSNPDELRKSRIFQSTKRLVEFQRDQYLVGSEYARMASRRRYSEEQQSTSDENDGAAFAKGTSKTTPSAGSRLASWATLRRLSPKEEDANAPEPPFPPPILPHDSTALGHIQIANVVAKTLLPLPALYDATLPWACKIPHWIYPPTQQALVNLILGQESNLDRILKRRLLTFLDNPHNRTAIKMSTQGYILSSSTTTTTSSSSSSSSPPPPSSESEAPKDKETSNASIPDR